MKPLVLTRERDAVAIAHAFAVTYQSYTFRAVKPKGARKWRIAINCKPTGAFLRYAVT